MASFISSLQLENEWVIRRIKDRLQLHSKDKVWICQLCKMCLASYYTQKDTEKNLLVVRMGKSVIQRAANKCQIKKN